MVEQIHLLQAEIRASLTSIEEAYKEIADLNRFQEFLEELTQIDT